MKQLLLRLLALLLGLTAGAWAGAPTTINDFHLPGSQPLQSGLIDLPSGCGCHSNYDESYEPMFTWQGSMMAHAQRDPLYLATLAVANQDAPQSGDLCIRCHAPRGWLEGRSTPTDGSALTSGDRESIVCHFCHKAIKPTQAGVNPYPGDTTYTDSTYAADQVYIGSMTDTTSVSGNGYYIIDSLDWRRGQYADADPPHNWYYSPYHRDAAMCGTCHDVSNPVFTIDGNGKYQPNSFDTPSPDFDTYTMFPVERTYSEWKMSEYNSAAGVYAPQFGGNVDTVRVCQDCHMQTVTGKAAKGGTPTRDNVGKHDLTGGNTFTPLMIDRAFPGDNVDPVALDSGIARATTMLQLAATMDLSASDDGTNHEVDVEITNQTGHKLPSGYPEGRRIWIAVQAYSETDQLLYASGAYDTSTAVLDHDVDLKVYQIKPGISTTLAPVVGEAAGPSFHFVLNDTIYSDNRIPPRGFTNANFAAIQSPPVAYTYADGQYWDNTLYTIPGAAAKVRVTLYYQTTSKEYVEFLQTENTTNDWGDSLYTFWTAYGQSLPVAMVTDSLSLTPIQTTNQPPVLASIGPQSTDEGVQLTFGVSATDPDGTTPVLTMSTLPGTATFTDHNDGTGTFDWTPTFDDAGSYDVTFYATDDSAAVDSEVVTITVNNVNRPPVLTSIGNRSVTVPDALTFDVSATDPDGQAVILTADPLPGTATFTDHNDGTGTFDWTPLEADTGSYDITFVAGDGGLADSELVTVTVLPPGTCCIARGNVDHSSDGEVIVSDLTYLVAFLFQGGPDPVCEEEADVDASGAINVSDLTYLVIYLFQGGDTPAPCL